MESRLVGAATPQPTTEAFTMFNIDPDIMREHATRAARRDAQNHPMPGVKGERPDHDWRDSEALREHWSENREGFMSWAKFQIMWGRSWLAPCAGRPEGMPPEVFELGRPLAV